MANELQTWFREMPFRLQKELAGELKKIADNLAADIRAAAPVGETGKLRDSVKVRRGRKTLEFFVEAGGDLTTKYYSRTASYQREVVIDGRDNRGIARGNHGVSYDYALAQEFGTEKQAAKPFFYSTYREKREQVRQDVEDAVTRVLGRL